jgi:hypothetical protein
MRRSLSTPRPVRVVLYTHPACPLCDRLEALLRPWVDELGLILDRRDIRDDRRWHDLYAQRVPVAEYDGRVILEGRPEPAEVDAAMTRLFPDA